MATPFFDKVVPRLLRPLETGGRSIRPSLIHGDLWHGNAETDAETGEPVIFDAASFYAHNECKSAKTLVAATTAAGDIGLTAADEQMRSR